MKSSPTKRLKILFADDEPSLQELMRLELPRMGHEVTVCPDGMTAVAALEKNVYDCLLVDLDMPGYNGIEVIDRAKRLNPDTEAIILTGKSSLDTAVAAIRQGAFDYLTKPCRLVEIDALLGRVAQKIELNHQCRALAGRLKRIEGSSELIGQTKSMAMVRSLIAKVAPTDSTVLILGETGTGKELAARAVHDQSARAEKPFVPVNCGALPENLIESELFGHCRGAFTGAEEHRTGLFEVADGGTLFLDEIGELPSSVQAKLLRFLESGEIRRIGENAPVICDVRVVCATHRDLDAMVRDETFREDLWFRINTFEICLPPLRDRIDDIPMLAASLVSRHRPGGMVIADEVIEVLKSHCWPGNVRELANVMEHALILCEKGPICIEHLPSRFTARRLRVAPGTIECRTLRELECYAIQEAMDRNQGNKTKAADDLGVSLKTLYNKLNQVLDKTG